jgi:hypothetical protein
LLLFDDDVVKNSFYACLANAFDNIFSGLPARIKPTKAHELSCSLLEKATEYILISFLPKVSQRPHAAMVKI